MDNYIILYIKLNKMEKFIIDYAVDYFKESTSKKKQIKNQELDQLLQLQLNINPLSDSGIRGLIHEIRRDVVIENEEGDKGWICGSSDGYYLSYNAIDILTHLMGYEGKINKMKMIHKRGMDMLKDKIYYKQQEINF